MWVRSSRGLQEVGSWVGGTEGPVDVVGEAAQRGGERRDLLGGPVGERPVEQLAVPVVGVGQRRLPRRGERENAGAAVALVGAPLDAALRHERGGAAAHGGGVA